MELELYTHLELYFIQKKNCKEKTKEKWKPPNADNKTKYEDILNANFRQIEMWEKVFSRIEPLNILVAAEFDKLIYLLKEIKLNPNRNQII